MPDEYAERDDGQNPDPRVVMELRHLRYFLAVAEKRSFTKAARDLNVAQPALSVQIRDLETEIGAKLFDRANRRTELTESGVVFLYRARDILAAVGEAAAAAREAASGSSGVVTLSFLSSLGGTLIPEVTKRLKENFPAVRLRLLESTTGAQLTLLQKGDVDIGIVRGPVVVQNTTAIVLRHDRFAAILPADHGLAQKSSVSTKDLRGLDFIFFPRNVAPGLYDQVMTICRAGGVEPIVTHEASDYRTVLDLVGAGIGVSLQPVTHLGALSPNVVARSLSDVQVSNDLLLLIGEQDTRAACATVRDCVLSVV